MTETQLSTAVIENPEMLKYTYSFLNQKEKAIKVERETEKKKSV